MLIEDFYAISGVVSILLLSVGALIYVTILAWETVRCNYYNAIRSEIRDILDILENNFEKDEKFTRDFVLQLLARIHNRHLVVADTLKNWKRTEEQK